MPLESDTNTSDLEDSIRARAALRRASISGRRGDVAACVWSVCVEGEGRRAQSVCMEGEGAWLSITQRAPTLTNFETPPPPVLPYFPRFGVLLVNLCIQLPCGLLLGIETRAVNRKLVPRFFQLSFAGR